MIYAKLFHLEGRIFLLRESKIDGNYALGLAGRNVRPQTKNNSLFSGRQEH